MKTLLVCLVCAGIVTVIPALWLQALIALVIFAVLDIGGAL